MCVRTITVCLSNPERPVLHRTMNAGFFFFMAEVKHTPEPWNSISDSLFGTLVRSEGLIIARVRENEFINHEANAERIVACVNACAGIPNEVLLSKNRKHVAFFEAIDLQVKLDATRKELEIVTAERDKLLKQEQDDRIVFLAALERAAEMMRRTKTGGYRIAHDGEIAHEEGSTFLQVAEALDLAKYGRANAS